MLETCSHVGCKSNKNGKSKDSRLQIMLLITPFDPTSYSLQARRYIAIGRSTCQFGVEKNPGCISCIATSATPCIDLFADTRLFFYDMLWKMGYACACINACICNTHVNSNSLGEI